MNFEYTSRSISLQSRMNEFMTEFIYPVEDEVNRYNLSAENSWTKWPGLERLKAKAGKRIMESFFTYILWKLKPWSYKS